MHRERPCCDGDDREIRTWRAKVWQQQLLDLSKQSSALSDFCFRLLDDANVSFFGHARSLNKGLRLPDGLLYADGEL